MILQCGVEVTADNLSLINWLEGSIWGDSLL
jgi:hypothetical protein